jgi:RNA polymerase sigma-70 factor (ECF subfamily)
VDELDLLERASRGDQQAFEAILRPLIQPAYRLALAMLGEREAAEDAVQEMALKGWRHHNRIRPALGTARPWLLAIVTNECRRSQYRSFGASHEQQPGARAVAMPAA